MKSQMMSALASDLSWCTNALRSDVENRKFFIPLALHMLMYYGKILWVQIIIDYVYWGWKILYLVCTLLSSTEPTVMITMIHMKLSFRKYVSSWIKGELIKSRFKLFFFSPRNENHLCASLWSRIYSSLCWFNWVENRMIFLRSIQFK